MKTSISILLMNMITKSPAIRGAVFAIIMLLFSGTLRAQQQTGVSVTAGREFYLTCLHNDNQMGGTAKVQLKVVVEKPCTITAKYNNSTNAYWKNWNGSSVIPVGIYTDDMLYNEVVNLSAGNSFKTMTITASEDITVYAINYVDQSTDASTILPTKIWGTEYRLATIGGTKPGYAVVAKEDGTKVTLENPNITVNLYKNEAYYYSDNADFSGNKISSNKPVAVFSGAQLGNIKSGLMPCCTQCATPLPEQITVDHCYEQLWSTDKWGKDFFVWPVATYPGYSHQYDWGGIIAIVANESGTNVSISGGINGTYNNLSAGSVQYLCQKMNSLCRVQSNKPVMVFTVLPDAAITYIPPVDQRILRATLSPFVMQGNSKITDHPVEMLIPAAYWNQTVIKENNVVANKNTYTVTPSAHFPDWITVRKVLPNTDIKIEVYCPGGLLAYMYGYGEAETYGYLAGAGAYDLRNYFTIRERETTVDTYYANTTETTHTFKSGDDITVKRTVESPVSGSIKWLINNVEYTATSESSSVLHSFTFPSSALVPGENSLTMRVRYQGAQQDSLYTGKIWLEQPSTSLSFGDAPESYDTAAHYLTNKLYLGSLWDPAKVQAKPVPSLNANTAGNDDALTLQTSTEGYTVLNQSGFTLNAQGHLTSTFNLTNNTSTSANLKGWIDFNRNGKFDVGEASANVSVPNSGNSQQTLTWNNAASKIQYGITYMRLRLSTEQINQPTDTLKDGEVEDYLLNLKLLNVSKTAVSNNPGTTARATLGDTITYTINISNASSAAFSNITVLDPIPLNTAYIAGSASNSGILKDITVKGHTVKGIEWTGITPPSGLSFKVEVTDIPQFHDPDDSLIVNIAYVLLNGDTIPSCGTCNVAEIIADSLNAVDDAVTMNAGVLVAIDILANDNLGKCDLSTIDVEIIVPPKNGNIEALDPAEKILRYTSDPAFVGKDSLTYKITCKGTVSLAKVRFTVSALPPVALDDRAYVFACDQSSAIDVLANDANIAPGAVINMQNGKYGSAHLYAPYVIYDHVVNDCDKHGGKTDTVRYKVCNPNGDCAEANIIVHILRIPQILVADSCSQKPYLQTNIQYKGATYRWFKSSNGTSNWQEINGETNTKLYVTEKNFYKIEVTYRGLTTDTPKAYFDIRKKYLLYNGNYWYDTTIN